MPRLNHKKTRTGCQRCKDRKVKCDENKPRCLACGRHNVICVYPQQLCARGSPDLHRGNPYPPPRGLPCSARGDEGPVNNGDSLLEVRLMHEWTAYTSKTFSTAWEFWCYQAPLIAVEFRYVLDAMLAMAALHASRRPPSQWVPSEGRMVPISNPAYHLSHDERDLTDHWKHLRRQSVMDSVVNVLNDPRDKELKASQRTAELLTAHRMYFDRAIEGYRKALNELTVDNIEAVFTASILVSFNALFTLSESEGDATLPTLDPSFWLRLCRGSKFIINRWHEMVGNAWIAKAGVYYGKPDLTDDHALFAVENARPFEKLLTFAEDFEAMTQEDREAYKMALYYIGGIYKGIVEGTDSPLATCRRLSAMPSRCPARFVDLVESKSPRAIVMLAHVFASMKLVDQNAVWFRGIAERQVPLIYDQLPNAWKEMMVWPMAVARGEVDREPRETQSEDSMSL